jgi:hypothetical protein
MSFCCNKKNSLLMNSALLIESYCCIQKRNNITHGVLHLWNVVLSGHANSFDSAISILERQIRHHLCLCVDIYIDLVSCVFQHTCSRQGPGCNAPHLFSQRYHLDARPKEKWLGKCKSYTISPINNLPQAADWKDVLDHLTWLAK